MKRLIITIAILVSFIIAACATYGEPIKLAYKFTKGELDKYKINMTTNMTMSGLIPGGGSITPIEMTMETVIHQRTLSVLPDGSAKIKVTHFAPKVKVSNLPKIKHFPIPKRSFSVVMHVASDGRVLGIEGMENLLATAGLKNFDVSRLANLMGQYAFLPSEPVEVGANWRQNIPLPLGGGDMTVDSVLESYGKQIWSIPSAVINQKFSAHMNLEKMLGPFADSAPIGAEERKMLRQLSGGLDFNGTMTFYFAPSIGKILKGDGQVWTAITIGMPPEAVKKGAPSEIAMAVDMKIRISRFN